jgi:alkylated DNA repair dioxygenase AlkB
MISRSNRTEPPEGFRYLLDFLDADEERDLVERIRPLPMTPFDFHGYLANRRVVSFGWRYSYDDRTLQQAEALPDFLLPVRATAAAFAGLAPEELPHALVTEYRPGTPIGWHRDKSVFGDVIGISLLSPCTFRFRRKSGSAWERYSFTAEPRSAYLLRGPSRTVWEHSIPEVTELRYSITFRSLKGRPADREPSARADA